MQALQSFEGEVVRDDAVYKEYDDARSISVEFLQLWPDFGWRHWELVGFKLNEALLTSMFVTIDTQQQRLFINQSYTGVAALFGNRFSVEGDRFRLNCQPLRLTGRHVVIGGSTNWYHWLFNWCPRLLLLRRLRPDMWEAPDVHFIVEPSMLHGPYRAVLDTFDIPLDRLRTVDPEQDYKLDEAYIVSFLDQNKLFPDLIREFATHLISTWNLSSEMETIGIFTSRQALGERRRRIYNFEEVEPVLIRAGLQIIDCGSLSAREQARLFRGAQVVVGGHGSDLTNVLFCRPGTKVLVFESQFSVDTTRHIGLKHLCEVLDLYYETIIVPTEGDIPPGTDIFDWRNPEIHNWINRDYRIDPAHLDMLLEDATRDTERVSSRDAGPV